MGGKADKLDSVTQRRSADSSSFPIGFLKDGMVKSSENLDLSKPSATKKNFPKTKVTKAKVAPKKGTHVRFADRVSKEKLRLLPILSTLKCLRDRRKC